MTHIKKIILTSKFILSSLLLIGQNDTIRHIPSEYVYPISLIGDSILSSKIRENQHILVGETHGVHESTVLIEQISQMKKFDRFITEIDSLSIKHLILNFSQADSILKKMPGAYTMYSFKEELILLQSLMEAGVQIEGIDLLHPASIRLILFELSQSSNLGQKSIVKLKDIIERHNRDLTTNGYLSLKTKKKTTHVLERISENIPISEKNLIDYIVNESYSGNLMEVRSIYMRNRLIELEKNQTLLTENVLFKFGGSHLKKNLNTAGYKDVGHYISQLNSQTFFIEIVPVSGKIGFPFCMDGEKSKSFNLESPYYEDLFDLRSNIESKNHVLFVDVEKFKKSLNSEVILSVHLQAILDNYDGVIFINEVSPSQID
jgi:hypothetical protein